jgi:hypothetical protein
MRIATSCLVAALALAGPAGALTRSVCDCAPGADADCVAGDDASAGTAAAPWRSYEKARTAFAALAAGDAILFCRGGAWQIAAGTRWVNGACLAAAPCRVGAYAPPWGTGDEGRPILERVDATHGFALEDGGDAEHEEGYVIEGLDLRGGGSGNGFFLYNDIDDVVLRDLSITGFDIGVHLAGSNPCNPSDPACDGRNERITLTDSYVADNESQGWLGASSGSKILDNVFERNGTTAVFDHNIYVSGSSGGQTQGIEVRGNHLYQSDLDDAGVCRAVSLVVHGEHDDLTIEGNTVVEDVGLAGQGCWGIAVDNGYGSAEGFTDVVIRGNTVRNVGNLAIGVGACVRCTIENNVIIHQQAFGTTAIAAPDRPPDAGDLLPDDITVRNNSIFIDTAGGATAIRVDDFGNDHVVVSNAILYTGSSSSFNCLAADLGAAAYTDVDHNLCWFPNAPGAEWSDGYGTDPDPLQAWRDATGFGGSSAMVDPGFADAAAGDLGPENAAAAMVDAGHPTLSSPMDIDGLPRDGQPDVGAYEWGAAGVLFADGFESGDTSAWDNTVPGAPAGVRPGPAPPDTMLSGGLAQTVRKPRGPTARQPPGRPDR